MDDDGTLTWRQALELRRLLPEGTRIDHLSRWEATGLIALHSPYAPWRKKPPSSRQEEFLRIHGQWREGLTRGKASDLIGEIKQQSWDI